MTDPIYAVSRSLIFFCCCIGHTCNCFSSLLNRTFAFMLHSEYTTSCYGKKCRMTQRNKQASQTFHCFVLNSHFIQLSECKYVHFCLIVCQTASIFYSVAFQILFGRRFLSAQLIYRGKVEFCHPLYDFRGKESIFFSWMLPTAKIKIREK